MDEEVRDLNAWEDDLLDDNQQPVEHNEEDSYDESYEDSYDESYEEEDDVLESFLKSKGINPNGIKFETEDGYEEIPFKELSKDEQLQILSDRDEDYDLTDDEINLLNQMRS